MSDQTDHESRVPWPLAPSDEIPEEVQAGLGKLFDSMKPTNPKDAVGSNKLPLHLWPASATMLGCLGLLDGTLKYGRSNWRSAGVRATIYNDAIRRHLDAWMEGEDVDPDSGLPHMSHVLASAAIIVDAQSQGKLVDDRMYQSPGQITGFRSFVNGLTQHVARLKENHSGKSPRHFTIADNDRT